MNRACSWSPAGTTARAWNGSEVNAVPRRNEGG